MRDSIRSATVCPALFRPPHRLPIPIKQIPQQVFTMQEPKAFSRQHISRAICVAMGFIFLVAGILKGLDIGLFARQIGHYGILPSLVLFGSSFTLSHNISE